MSGECCQNPPTLTSNSGNNEAADDGKIQQVGGLPSYVSGTSHSTTALLLISDVYGFEAPKLRKLADKVAEATGFYVVVPDFFHGDPYPTDRSKPIMDWIKIHGMDKGIEEAKPVIEDLKSKGIKKIGAAGFCWGGKVVVGLAKHDIDAGVLLHPSFVTVEDIQEVKVPLAILGAETDQLAPPELVKQFEAILNTKPEVPSFVKIFEGVAHGWTVRYKDEDEHEVRSANESHGNMIDWFVKHLN